MLQLEHPIPGKFQDIKRTNRGLELIDHPYSYTYPYTYSSTYSPESNSNFLELLNYPVGVEITSDAIRAIDHIHKVEETSSSILIRANFLSGKNICVFIIGSRFFDRIKRDINSTKKWLTYDVGLFTRRRYIDNYCYEDHTERRFCGVFSKKDTSGKDVSVIDQHDIMTHFSATYDLDKRGVPCKTIQSCEFKQEKFPVCSTPLEKIALRMDILPQSSYDLVMFQL
jgi:hypothetical protein